MEKGQKVIFKGEEVEIIFCSLNKVKIRLKSGEEKFVSYIHLL